MQSTETKVFGEPQIAEAEVPLKVDPEKPLHVSWTTGKILSNSIVTVQIGRPERDDAIYCVFPAKDLSGDIDAQMINALEKDKHVILVELSSNQLWAQGGWLINTIDWRSGRIER
jgi:hypothetical protein